MVTIIDCLTEYDIFNNNNDNNEKYYELWFSKKWALPTDIYLIVFSILKVIEFSESIVTLITHPKEKHTFYKLPELYYCLQNLLLKRIHFQVIFYQGENKIGALSWLK